VQVAPPGSSPASPDSPDPGGIRSDFDLIRQGGPEFEEREPERVDPPRESALKLKKGGVVVRRTVRIDEIQRRFDLNEVELAVQIGTPGEFARLRNARSRGTRRVEHEGGNEGTPVTADLHHVLARE